MMGAATGKPSTNLQIRDRMRRWVEQKTTYNMLRMPLDLTDYSARPGPSREAAQLERP